MVSTVTFRGPEMETNFFFKKEIKKMKFEFKGELKLMHLRKFLLFQLYEIQDLKKYQYLSLIHI